MTLSQPRKVSRFLAAKSGQAAQDGKEDFLHNVGRVA